MSLAKWVANKSRDKELGRQDLMHNGREVATVWNNGIWHTWDSDGVGGENDREYSVCQAKLEATLSAFNQGFLSEPEEVE